MMKASLQTSDQKDIQINYLQQQLLSTRQVNIFAILMFSVEDIFFMKFLIFNLKKTRIFNSLFDIFILYNFIR